MKTQYTLHYKLEGERRKRVPVNSVTEAIEHLKARLPARVETVPVVLDRSRHCVAILKAS